MFHPESKSCSFRHVVSSDTLSLFSIAFAILQQIMWFVWMMRASHVTCWFDALSTCAKWSQAGSKKWSCQKMSFTFRQRRPWPWVCHGQMSQMSEEPNPPATQSTFACSLKHQKPRKKKRLDMVPGHFWQMMNCESRPGRSVVLWDKFYGRQVVPGGWKCPVPSKQLLVGHEAVGIWAIFYTHKSWFDTVWFPLTNANGCL